MLLDLGGGLGVLDWLTYAWAGFRLVVLGFVGFGRRRRAGLVDRDFGRDVDDALRDRRAGGRRVTRLLVGRVDSHGRWGDGDSAWSWRSWRSWLARRDCDCALRWCRSRLARRDGDRTLHRRSRLARCNRDGRWRHRRKRNNRSAERDRRLNSHRTPGRTSCLRTIRANLADRNRRTDEERVLRGDDDSSRRQSDRSWLGRDRVDRSGVWRWRPSCNRDRRRRLGSIEYIDDRAGVRQSGGCGECRRHEA